MRVSLSIVQRRYQFNQINYYTSANSFLDSDVVCWYLPSFLPPFPRSPRYIFFLSIKPTLVLSSHFNQYTYSMAYTFIYIYIHELN